MAMMGWLICGGGDGDGDGDDDGDVVLMVLLICGYDGVVLICGGDLKKRKRESGERNK